MVDIRTLIAQYPELSWTTPDGGSVAFVPHREVSGTLTHAYAVPYVGNDECLVTCRQDGEWAIPGGTMEPGETWQETLYRELLEETGSRIDRYEPVGAYRVTRDETTFRMICWAEVTQIQALTEPDTGPTSIVEVRRIRPNDAPVLFTGRTAHFGSVYTLIDSVYLTASHRRRTPVVTSPAPADRYTDD